MSSRSVAVAVAWSESEPTPEEERQLEIDALHAEIAWIQSNECPAVFGRISSLLESCLVQLQDASDTSNLNEPLRGESPDGALRFAMTLGPRDVQALQVQLSLPKWNRGIPWKSAVGGGRRVSIVLPQLLVLHNKLGQAVAALSDGYATLADARTLLSKLLCLLPDALRAVARPAGQLLPSGRARALTDQMSPAPPTPPEVVLDAMVWSAPARLALSVYLLRGDHAATTGDEAVAAEARHASAPLPGLGRTLRDLETAVALCRGLRAKLQPLEEMAEEMLGLALSDQQPVAPAGANQTSE